MSHLDAWTIWLVSALLCPLVGISGFCAWVFRDDRPYLFLGLVAVAVGVGALAIGAYLLMGGRH